MKRAWPVLRVTLVVAMLALTAYGGINDGRSTFREAKTPGESAAAASQLFYGGLSIAVLLAMALRPRWVSGLLVAWGVALTVTAPSRRSSGASRAGRWERWPAWPPLGSPGS